MLIRVLILSFSLGIASGQSVGEFTQQASQLVLRHQWEEAISLLKAGLDQYPDQPQLLLQLGSLLVSSGRFGEGEKLLQEALEQQPGNSEVLRNAGEAQLEQGRFSSAVALFRESLRHSSENVEAHHRLAFSLLAQGQEELALEHSRHAVELNPLDPRFRRLYAFLLDTQGEEETANEQLKLAYRLAPRDSKLLFELSQRRRLAGHLFQALEYLELATEVDPENPLYHGRLSDLYEQLDQTERAGEEAKRESDLRQAFEQYLTAMSLAVNGKKLRQLAFWSPSSRPIRSSSRE